VYVRRRHLPIRAAVAQHSDYRKAFSMKNRMHTALLATALMLLLIPTHSSEGVQDIAAQHIETTTSTSTTTTQAPTTTTSTAPSTTTTAQRKTPKAANRGSGRTPSGGEVLARIATCESHNNYAAQNAHSTASGKYQVLDSTWGRYGGYARAKDAPAATQEQQAHEMYARSGSAPWAASRECWK
jgi:hypothetical protein